MSNRTENLPLLPLRDVVIFPSVVTPLFVGREKSIIALQASMASDKQIMLVAQKEAQNDNPQGKDVYEVGTISTILQLIKLPDGTVNEMNVPDGFVGHGTNIVKHQMKNVGDDTIKVIIVDHKKLKATKE